MLKTNSLLKTLWKIEFLLRLPLLSIGILSFGLITSGDAYEYDIYLLGGQSNASGQARTNGLDPANFSNANVMLFHSASLTSGGPPAGNGALAWTTLQPAPAGIANRFGPEIGLGNRLDQLLPDRNIAIIKHARGATALSADVDNGNNWHPGANNSDTANYGDQYAEFVDTVTAALQALTDGGHTFTIRGMHWQQGEGDARTQALADAYATNLRHLIGRVREQFSSLDMLFSYGTVHNGIDPTFELNLRASQKAVDAYSGSAYSTPGAFLVPIHDTSILPNEPIHIDGLATLELGKRAAERLFLPQRIKRPAESQVVSIDFSLNLDEQGTATSNTTAKLYFGKGPAPESGPYWNSAPTILDEANNNRVKTGQVFNDLLASDGSSAGDLYVELTEGFASAFNPNTIINPLQADRIFTNSNLGVNYETGVVTISGLNSNNLYDIYLVGAAAFDTYYTIGTQTLSDKTGEATITTTDPQGNLTFNKSVSHVEFVDIAPNGVGQIRIEITGKGQAIGVLSGLQIVAKPIELPTPACATLFGLGLLSSMLFNHRF